MTNEEQSKQHIIELTEHRQNGSLLTYVNIVWGISLLLFLAVAFYILYGWYQLRLSMHGVRRVGGIGAIAGLMIGAAAKLASKMSAMVYKNLIISRLVEAEIGIDSFNANTPTRALSTAFEHLSKSELFSAVEEEKKDLGDVNDEVKAEDFFAGTINGRYFELCDLTLTRQYGNDENNQETLFHGLFMTVPVHTKDTVLATSDEKMLAHALPHFAKPFHTEYHEALIQEIEKTVRWISPTANYMLFVRNQVAHVFVPIEDDMFDISLFIPATEKTIRRDYTSVIACQHMAELLVNSHVRMCE